ncbi:hypothetical protein WJX84_001254 [Apatococcus fuscideae]|uniref:Uncharacterized protein n=1 Tax=Apatococcus fuscideae TaxID=2026836 RepID=A0AAW1T4W2_9CHLO
MTVIGRKNVFEKGGVTCDHKSVLMRPGSADIFFPTDFPLLTHMHSRAGQQHSLASDVSGRHMKDYSNFSIYLGGTLQPKP